MWGRVYSVYWLNRKLIQQIKYLLGTYYVSGIVQEEKKKLIVCGDYQGILIYYKFNLNIWVVVKTRKHNLSLIE